MHLFKSKASTLQKIAELPKYTHPADLHRIHIRPVKQQKLEINGKLNFGENLYFSASQEQLVKSLITTRSRYRSQNIQNRLSIADKQFATWKQYLNDRVHQLTQHEKIEGTRRQKVYESYLNAKQRKQEQLQMSRTIKLFYQLQKGYKFDIALHPIIMMKMVHPHYGYLNNYQHIRLPFAQLCAYLQEMVVVSKIFEEGNTLHAHQLMSFTFWKLNACQPTLKMRQFTNFLRAFRFNISEENQKEDMNKILHYHLQSCEGEIKEQVLVRFDFWRNMFLERGL